jgi:hypothetical protein
MGRRASGVGFLERRGERKNHMKVVKRKEATITTDPGWPDDNVSFEFFGHKTEKITSSSIHLQFAPRPFVGMRAEPSEATVEDRANSPWKVKMLR